MHRVGVARRGRIGPSGVFPGPLLFVGSRDDGRMIILDSLVIASGRSGRSVVASVDFVEQKPCVQEPPEKRQMYIPD
jgi:hypothetical protein